MWRRIWWQTFEDDSPAAERCDWLQLLLAVSSFLLLGATWRLWWSSGEFPQVPWFRWGCQLPTSIDQVLVWGLLVALLSILIRSILMGTFHSERPVWSLRLFTACGCGLVLLNQQRAQPWMYHFLLLAVVLAEAPTQRIPALLRVLTVSLYFHSGLSKLDLSFCQGLGDAFWQTGRAVLQLKAVNPGPNPNLWPLLFPIGEILIAAGLAWPATRRTALLAACLMHVGLLVLLGPWGMNHRPGVLLWNAYFILQNLILFGTSDSTRTPGSASKTPVLHEISNSNTNPEFPHSPAKTIADAESSDRVNSGASTSKPAQDHDKSLAAKTQPTTWRLVIVRVLIGFVVVWPFTEPWGICDVWFAWGLYAEHGEQLTIKVNETGFEKLSPIWRNSAAPLSNDFDPESHHVQEWRLRPKSVSLDRIHAPVYPSNRFMLGVALEIASANGLQDNEISGEYQYPANRWSGIRKTRTLKNLKDIQQAANNCWFNAHPR